MNRFSFALGFGLFLTSFGHAQTWAFVAGNQTGQAPRVNKVNPGLSFGGGFDAYPQSFTGGVRVAVGDVTGDGVKDIITGAGPGGGPHVKVFDGVTGSEVRSFFAFDTSFAGGVTVASGDINGDGFSDIVVGTGSLSSRVSVFSGQSGALIQDFFAFAPTFSGGVNVAAGDLNGDGRADIVAGTATGTSQVNTFSGLNGTQLSSFFAYAPFFTGGVSLSVADFDGTGFGNIITGTASASTQVKVFNSNLTERASFFAFQPTSTLGVNVSATNVGRLGLEQSIIVSTASVFPTVKLFDPVTTSERSSSFGFWQAGAPVAGNWVTPVPEPATVGGLFLGIGLLIKKRKRTQLVAEK